MTKPKIKKILIYSVLAVVAGGIAIYVFLILREKAQFAQAEKEIDALYAQIVEKVGKPDQEKKTKSCGYASRAYGKGPRYCNARNYLLYEKSDLTTSNTRMTKSSLLVNTPLQDERVREPRTEFYQHSEGETDQSFVQPLNTKTSLNCSAKYTYPVLPNMIAPERTLLERFTKHPSTNLI